MNKQVHETIQRFTVSETQYCGIIAVLTGGNADTIEDKRRKRRTNKWNNDPLDIPLRMRFVDMYFAENYRSVDWNDVDAQIEKEFQLF